MRASLTKNMAACAAMAGPAKGDLLSKESGDHRSLSTGDGVPAGTCLTFPPKKLAGASSPAIFGDEFEITLPLPPSTNALFASVGRRRIKTRQYRDWLSRCATVVRTAEILPVRDWYDLRVSVPIGIRGDIDNRVKAINDLIVSVGLVADDKFQNSVFVTRDPHAQPGNCVINVARHEKQSAAPFGGDGGPKPCRRSTSPQARAGRVEAATT